MAACLAWGPSAHRLQQRGMPFILAVFLVASQMRRGKDGNPVELGKHSLEQIPPLALQHVAAPRQLHTCTANTMFGEEVAVWFSWTSWSTSAQLLLFQFASRPMNNARALKVVHVCKIICFYMEVFELMFCWLADDATDILSVSLGLSCPRHCHWSTLRHRLDTTANVKLGASWVEWIVLFLFCTLEIGIQTNNKKRYN